MAAVERGKWQAQRFREMEIDRVVSLQVVSIGQVNDPSRRDRLEMYSHVEALWLFKRLLREPARLPLAREAFAARLSKSLFGCTGAAAFLQTADVRCNPFGRGATSRRIDLTRHDNGFERFHEALVLAAFATAIASYRNRPQDALTQLRDDRKLVVTQLCCRARQTIKPSRLREGFFVFRPDRVDRAMLLKNLASRPASSPPCGRQGLARPAPPSVAPDFRKGWDRFPNEWEPPSLD